MNRGVLGWRVSNDAVPRASGDEPVTTEINEAKQACSPRQRG